MWGCGGGAPICGLTQARVALSLSRACPKREESNAKLVVASHSWLLVPFNLFEYPTQAISLYRIDHFDKIYASLQM